MAPLPLVPGIYINSSTSSSPANCSPQRLRDVNILTPVTRSIQTMPPEGFINHTALYNKELHAWSRWHLPKIEGSTIKPIVLDFTTDLDVFGNRDEVEAAVTTALSFAYPIAGRLYLEYSYPRLGLERSSKCSGFWLEGKYFMTCAHIFGEIFMEIPEREFFITLFGSPNREDKAKISVSTGQNVLPYRVPDTTFVKLMNVDLKADIAIYRAVSEESGTEPSKSGHTITTKDFKTLTPGYDGAVFSVAYSQSGEVTFNSRQGQSVLKGLSKPDKAFYEKKVVKDGTNFTVFDYCMDRYLDILPTNKQFPELEKIRDNPPSFSSIYSPDSRAFAAGNVVKTDKVRKEEQHKTELLRVTTHELTALKDYSISSWFGISGGMVGIVEAHESGHSAKIVGIVKGRDPQVNETNQFIAFTEDTIAWIEEVIHSSSEQPPKEFGADDFLKRHRGSVNA